MLGIVCLCVCLYVFVNMPVLIHTVYGGNFMQVQAALFGFEGYLDEKETMGTAPARLLTPRSQV